MVSSDDEHKHWNNWTLNTEHSNPKCIPNWRKTINLLNQTFWMHSHLKICSSLFFLFLLLQYTSSQLFIVNLHTFTLKFCRPKLLHDFLLLFCVYSFIRSFNQLLHAFVSFLDLCARKFFALHTHTHTPNKQCDSDAKFHQTNYSLLKIAHRFQTLNRRRKLIVLWYRLQSAIANRSDLHRRLSPLQSGAFNFQRF